MSSESTDFIREDSDPRDADIDFVTAKTAQLHVAAPIKPISVVESVQPAPVSSTPTHKPAVQSAGKTRPLPQSNLALCSKLYGVLESLDMLQEYGAKFASEDIKIDDIPLLSDADLSSLVPKLGPRRRLLAAIQSSNSASSTTTEAPRPSFHINSTQPPTVQSLLASPTHKRPMSATTPKSSHLTLNTVEERDESPLRRVHNSMALLTPKASTPKAGTPKALSARSPPPQQYYALSPLSQSFSEATAFTFSSSPNSQPAQSLTRAASQPSLPWLPSSSLLPRPASATGSSAEARLINEFDETKFKAYRRAGSPGINRTRPHSAMERAMYPNKFKFQNVPDGAVVRPMYSAPDDCLNCTFQPRVNPEVLESSSSEPLSERIVRQIEDYNQYRKFGNPEAERRSSFAKECTFRPAVSEAVLNHKTDKPVLERMLESPGRTRKQLSQASRPQSAPASRHKFEGASFSAFYERCQQDIQEKEARLQASTERNRPNAECTFEPVLSPKIQSYKTKDTILKRLLSDIEERKYRAEEAQAEKERERKRNAKLVLIGRKK